MLATVQELALPEPGPLPLREINASTPTARRRSHERTDRPLPLAAEQPAAILRVSESSGHNVGHDHSDELTSAIVPCASQDAG